MASVDTYFLQPFRTNRKRLVPAQRVPAKTKHHALNDGERLARTAEGVAVIHVVADDETGEVARSRSWRGMAPFRRSSRSRSGRSNQFALSHAAVDESVAMPLHRRSFLVSSARGCEARSAVWRFGFQNSVLRTDMCSA